LDALFAVRNPDVLDLCSMLEEPSSLALLRVEPVDDPPLVAPNLLQISNRHSLRRCDHGHISTAPDGVNIIVLRERLQKLRSVAGHDVDRAAGQIAGIEKL